MGILRDFERRLEGAVEGFFARAFRSGLQPVELAKAVQRYAADYQQVGIDGVFVPNVYRFQLSPQDHERFTGIEGDLRHELADVLRRTAADRGWRLKGPVRIELLADEGVRVGTYELRGKAESGADQPARGGRGGEGGGQDARPARPERPRDVVAPAATSVLPQQPTPARARLRVESGGHAGADHTIGARAIIGRLPECDITIDEPSVSRRHARVERDGSRWTIEDLGSTNGVKVNGSSVQRSSLSDGDRVELGSVRLAFRVEAS